MCDWELRNKHFFNHNHAKVTCATFHKASGVPLVAAASVGGGYWLLVHYSGVAVDLAVQHGPRLAAQAARASAS